MRLALLVLDGPQKGAVLGLKNNLVLKKLDFHDTEMSDEHAVVDLDSALSWSINGLGDSLIRVGSSEAPRFSLLKGLVFHLGQTGFKVIEKPAATFESTDVAMASWLEKQTWTTRISGIFFFLRPIRLVFLKGPQADQFYTISYGPRYLGFNNSDLNIVDPDFASNLLRFYQVGDVAYVENLVGDKVLVNNVAFDHHVISDGDQIKFGVNVIEVSLLK
jgi:hypothetical protein